MKYQNLTSRTTVEKYTADICARYGLAENLFAGSFSKRFSQNRIDIDAQSESWQKRLIPAKFVVKYIDEDNRFVIWENRPGRLTFYISKKDYLAAQDCPIGFTLKGRVYKAWGEERVWVLSPEQLENFIANITNI